MGDERDRITSLQVLKILELVQEFVGSNPNEVTTLADNSRLLEIIHSRVNQPDVARVH